MVIMHIVLVFIVSTLIIVYYQDFFGRLFDTF